MPRRSGNGEVGWNPDVRRPGALPDQRAPKAAAVLLINTFGTSACTSRPVGSDHRPCQPAPLRATHPIISRSRRLRHMAHYRVGARAKCDPPLAVGRETRANPLL